VGTTAKVNQMLKLPNGTFRVLVEGLERGEIVRFTDVDDEVLVEINELESISKNNNEEEALMRKLLELFDQYTKVSKKITKETYATVADIDEPGRLADIAASHLSLKLKDKQKILEIRDVKTRLEHLIDLISNEKKVL